MNEKEIGEISIEAEEGGQATVSAKSEVAVSDEDRKLEEQVAGPVKRGRGRPPKNQKPDQAEAANPANMAEDVWAMPGMQVSDPAETERENSSDSEKTDTAYPERPPAQDFVMVSRGMQLLTELVKTQNQTQEKLIRSQTEFSSSVMDRMDQYRMQISKLESEAAEKEKNRLRDSYLEAQQKADERMEEIHQLRTQLDLSGRKVLKLNVRVEKLTEENESLRQQLQAFKDRAVEGSMIAAGDRVTDNASGAAVEVGASGVEGLDKDSIAASGAGALDQNPPSTSGAGASNQNPSNASRVGASEKKTTHASASGKGETSSGFCGWGQRRRKKFLEKVYCDRRYSDQQIALIQEADRAGIPLSGLKELCDPKISLGNMQVMLSYMKR